MSGTWDNSPEKAALDALADHAVLGREEQRDLIRLWQDSQDVDARSRVVEHNIKLVMKVAKRVCKDVSSPLFMDLLQSGVLGLMKAIDKFELDRGFAFSTYAIWWVRSKVGDESRLHARRLMRLKHLHTEVNKARKELQNELGREPVDDEIYERLGWGTDTQMRYELVKDSQVVSIDHVKPEDLHVASSAVEEREAGADSSLKDLLDTELRGDILSGLQILSRRRRDVIQRRNQIGYDHVHTYGELAARHKVGRDRIKEMENAGLRQLWLFVEDGRIV